MCLNLRGITTDKFLILKNILQGEWQRVLRYSINKQINFINLRIRESLLCPW